MCSEILRSCNEKRKGGQVVSFDYDDANAVTDVKVSQPGWSTLTVADYKYDNMGRVTKVEWGDLGSTTYDYDGIGRVHTHTLTDFNKTTLGYNPASQIVSRSVTDSAMQALLPSSSPVSYVPNDLNQYDSVDGSTLGYDDNGNLIEYNGWVYGYDAHNRLVLAFLPGSPSLDLDLDYDSNGRLISTTLESSTTNYVYSGDQLIGEYDPAGNPINLYVYAPGGDIPIARFSGSNGLNDMQYLRADERGSIVVETDGTLVLERHQYDVYGVPLEERKRLRTSTLNPHPTIPNDYCHRFKAFICLSWTHAKTKIPPDLYQRHTVLPLHLPLCKACLPVRF